GGVLVLTTPNAAFVKRDNEPATVWSALSPGYHAFLFTAEGLRQLLQRHGYAHIEVRAEGARLFAWASTQSFQLATDLAPLRERYQQVAQNDSAGALLWYDGARKALAQLMRLSVLHGLESVHVGWHALWQRLPALLGTRRWGELPAAAALVADAALTPQADFGFARAPAEASCSLLFDVMRILAQQGRWHDVQAMVPCLDRLG